MSSAAHSRRSPPDAGGKKLLRPGVPPFEKSEGLEPEGGVRVLVQAAVGVSAEARNAGSSRGFELSIGKSDVRSGRARPEEGCPAMLWGVGSNLVDPASSHMLVSKIKPCMSKYKLLYGETANGSLKQLSSP